MTTALRDGYSLQVNDLVLDIEDHEIGGQASSIAAELGAHYGLDDVPFEAGDIAVDVGAHVGIVSIYLAKKYPDITVYAYEPVPENYGRLVRNVLVNEVKNVIARPLAVTGDGRDLELSVDLAANSGGSSAFSTGGERITVKSVTLDDVPGPIRLLKIDCEGAEHEILADELLGRVEYLCGEIHANQTLSQPGLVIDRIATTLGQDKFRLTRCVMAD